AVRLCVVETIGPCGGRGQRRKCLSRQRKGPGDNSCHRVRRVGTAGFEPTTSCTPSKRASQAALRPVVLDTSVVTHPAGSGNHVRPVEPKLDPTTDPAVRSGHLNPGPPPGSLTNSP